jgi:hypothetical protein
MTFEKLAACELQQQWHIPVEGEGRLRRPYFQRGFLSHIVAENLIESGGAVSVNLYK